MVDGCNRVSGFAPGTVATTVLGVVRVLLAGWLGIVLFQVAITPGIFGLPDAFTVMESVVVVGMTLVIAFGGGGRT